MDNKNVLTAKQRLLKQLARMRVSLFIVLVVAGLGYAVVLLSQMLEEASDVSGYTSPLKLQEIDQTTLDRIQSLHTSNEKFEPPQLPNGRINPFSE